jgi:hypothetical protein
MAWPGAERKGIAGDDRRGEAWRGRELQARKNKAGAQIMRRNGKRKTEHKQCSFKTIQISVEAHHMLGAVAAQLMQPIGRTVESFAISWARHIGVEAQVKR